jgi:hypothetical protein
MLIIRRTEKEETDKQTERKNERGTFMTDANHKERGRDKLPLSLSSWLSKINETKKLFNLAC